MEVPAISNAGGSYGLSQGSASVAAVQASSSTAIDMTGADGSSLSVTMANQVNMVYADMSQGGGINDQTIKALIMLLLIQMMLKGGMDDQTQGMLSDLANAFQSSGQSDMSMIAMQASSMVQIDMSGMGGDMAVTAGSSVSAVGLDVMA